MKRIDIKTIAILLNDNARNVNDSIKKQVENLIPRKNIFYTKSLEEADATIEKILNMDFTHVFTGGGDGTLVYFINKMKEIKRDSKTIEELPTVGVLKLGTGNAIAIYTNSGKKITSDLREVIKGGHYRTKPVRFVKLDNKYFTFGGFGTDALILNDYNMMKQIKNKTLRWPFLGLKGYFTSALLVTLPKTVFKKKKSIEIYANNDQAYKVSQSTGFKKLSIKKGDLIYKGYFTLVPIGSTPYFGYGLKLLPYASKKDGFFQIRVINVPPLLMLYKVLRVWNGIYEGDDITDFLVNDVTVKFSENTPFQISGDAAGYRKETRVSLSNEEIDFIDFTD